MQTLTVYYDMMHDVEEMDGLAEQIAGSKAVYKGGDLNVRKLQFKFAKEAALERAQREMLDDGRYRLFP